MSTSIEKIRGELEGLDFTNIELKKAVFKLLSLKESKVLTRGLQATDPPKKKKTDPIVRPDGGPSEEKILTDLIQGQLATVSSKDKEIIQELLNM